jgi:hypothetical protein
LNRKKNILKAGIALGALVAALTGCSMNTPSATSSDMCAYSQGTGVDNNDAAVHKVFLPNEKLDYSLQNEKIFFFPCNARNLRFAKGSTDKTADNQPIGPINTRTSANTPVQIEVRIDLTLNQYKDVLKNDFIPWCKKYNCASGDANVRNDNFSTDGWTTGFLGENAVPALQTSTVNAVRSFDDTYWQDPTKIAALQTRIAENFTNTIRGTMGSTKDLFCGSGDTSGWTGDKPGQGTFECSPVRVTVTSFDTTDRDRIELANRSKLAEETKSTNSKELDAAKEKYGPDAAKVLGDLDRIEACAKSSKECNVYVGTSPGSTK